MSPLAADGPTFDVGRHCDVTRPGWCSAADAEIIDCSCVPRRCLASPSATCTEFSSLESRSAVGNGYWWSRQVFAVGRPSRTGIADDWRTTSLGVTSRLRHLCWRRYITSSAPRTCVVDPLLRFIIFALLFRRSV